ncbi:hypothetical protein [Deinococcus pimensis]|uniref:hypothetical protein n=1 Tax=Deinococcus pimensis TaxID=309888 RepID=UPI000483C796|nr:hypothetical protein [Deinococcus pimensis]
MTLLPTWWLPLVLSSVVLAAVTLALGRRGAVWGLPGFVAFTVVWPDASLHGLALVCTPFVVVGTALQLLAWRAPRGLRDPLGRVGPRRSRDTSWLAVALALTLGGVALAITVSSRHP